MSEPTEVQMQILKTRFPHIGEPALRRNWAVLIEGGVNQHYHFPSVPVVTPAKNRLRQKSGQKLNKTERAFFEYLCANYDPRKIRAQAVTLLLCNGVRYTPDFTHLDCRLAWETKGFMRDDAAVKIKMAASVYPEFKFYLVTRNKGGEWCIQEILP